MPAAKFRRAVDRIQKRRTRQMLDDMRALRAATKGSLSEQETFEAVMTAIAAVHIDEFRLLLAVGDPDAIGATIDAELAKLLHGAIDQALMSPPDPGLH